ncbi:hypothetical protein [Streptacidiphilus melanogenes]|uniref:hypothetical protein n=1 Tax=Streptacidiphilus melanogenes TaxID=411235 RepID=UPI00126A47CD|nr:hypothetical protein [Streptacidiphilus melanogenes]
MSALIVVSGFVALLDERYQRIGERHPCRFQWWSLAPGTWTVRLLEPTEIPFPSTSESAWYLAYYGESGERLFMCPLLGRPLTGVDLRLQ